MDIKHAVTEGSYGRRRSLRDAILSPHSLRLFGSSENIETHKRNVQLMDDRCVVVEFTSKTTGRALRNEMCRYLRVLNSASYFGIRYTDENDNSQWMDLDEKVLKQIKDLKDNILRLRVMFYPPDPLEDFKDGTSKHLLYLQLRRDFFIGRLRADSSTAYDLAAYAIQAEHGLKSIPGGFDIVHVPGGMRVLPHVSKVFVKRVQQKLESLLKLSKEEARDEFLRKASTIETYGMEPFQVKDQLGNGLCIGFNHLGISAFKNGQRTDVFEWKNIKYIKQSKKQLIIVIPRGQDFVKLGFKCQGIDEAKMLQRRALACKYFERASDSGRRSQLQFEIDSDCTESSTTDESRSTSTPEFRRREASQPNLLRYIPANQWSMQITNSRLDVPILSSPPLDRSNLNGSSSLRERSRGSLTTEAQAFPVDTNHYLFTRSSINLSKE
ncbi:unnamed protein product [Calicophoron daubneyi]|uniref:FERM domain-containing protein n=1 Tax=Calicophoron daubneyi TaxID=300641 RepID=A0AAV2TUR5_CALDB